MTSLHLKLWRDLWRLRAQVLAIALVISSGVAILIMSLSTYHSLAKTQQQYYKDSYFADLFVHCKRAPLHLINRIQQIPGIKQVSPRVTAYVNLRISNFNEPVLGHILSVPDFSEPLINKPYLRKGRWIQPFRDNEVILSEAFAKAHRLTLGDSIDAVIHGRFKTLQIVGIALSAEHIYQIAPGALFPDYKRYGVLWMALTPLSTAFDLENAFNDLVIRIQPDAHPKDIMKRLDLILKPYGGQISFSREDQLSHKFLSEELKQLATMSILFPIIFFGVAAFLLNIVINRLVANQRNQIALLKAFGYSNTSIGMHFLYLVSIIVSLGIVLGVIIGAWFGHGLSAIYAEFYRFPYLIYDLRPQEVIIAICVSLGVSSVGALLAVKRAVTLQPAQAMRPPTPRLFKSTWFERLFIDKLHSISKMIARNVTRKPLKSCLSVLGIACALGILMVGNFQQGAIDHMIHIQYGKIQRQDITVNFNEPTSTKTLSSLRGLEGVQYAEGHRVVAVQLKNRQHSYRTSIHGFPEHPHLERPLDSHFKAMTLPKKGIVLTDYLAKLLEVQIGDLIEVDVLEGHQQSLMIPVVGLSKQYLGLAAFAHIDYVNQIMREGPAINTVSLSVDPLYNEWLYPKLQEMPQVVGIGIKERMIQTFYETFGDTILIFTFIISVLGAILAFGIIYNNARINLTERDLELATMRVLGFHHYEISLLMLGELWVLTLIALPLGCVIGYYLCLFLSHNLQSDLYRVPLILNKNAYTTAIWIVLASTMVSCAILIKNIKDLDMISALKAKE